MRLKYLFAIALLAAVALAKEPRHYQSGKLLKMQSVKCGTDEKNGKSLAGEMIGTVGLLRFDFEHRRAEVGYEIARRFWRTR